MEQLGAKLQLSQDKALLFLAAAVRDRQQADVSAFLPYAQRYINELAAMTFSDFQTPESLDESIGTSHPAALEGRPDKRSGAVQPAEKSNGAHHIDSSSPSTPKSS